ncbi:c-type cytochrome, partial [Psychromonas sp.]|nr:c-type cytochrome [Psychromonas sp.]
MLKYKIRLAIVLTSLLSISISYAKQQAMPFPDTEFTTVDTCKSCHGQDGLGVPNFTPMLAGLSEEYLEQQIKLYQTGRRANLMMTPMSQKVEDPKL